MSPSQRGLLPYIESNSILRFFSTEAEISRPVPQLQKRAKNGRFAFLLPSWDKMVMEKSSEIFKMSKSDQKHQIYSYWMSLNLMQINSQITKPIIRLCRLPVYLF